VILLGKPDFVKEKIANSWQRKQVKVTELPPEKSKLV